MAEHPPSVLFIDDNEEELHATAQALRGTSDLKVASATPTELTIADLDGVDLVLVDLELKLDGESFLTAPDGVALASVLRRRLVKRTQPIGFAILTSQPQLLADPLPPTNRQPLLAAQHNLEWVFTKGEPDWRQRVASLAHAIQSIPSAWGDGIDNVAEVAPQLGVEGSDDAAQVWEIVERARPPIYEFSSWSHGLAFVRWLAHMALPYPGFLWDSHRLAARWRVTHAAFEQSFVECPALVEWLSDARYTGLLSDFSGRRWWRHRIEQLVWDATDGDAQNVEALRGAISAKAGRSLEPTEQAQPIVVVDGDMRPQSVFASTAEAARIQPDGWPVSADPAWMRLSDLKPGSPFRRLVIDEDREKLPGGGADA